MFKEFEVFTAMTVKNVFWDVAPCRSWGTDVSKEHIASIFKVEILSELLFILLANC
jgi:hypothetical protein